MWSYYDRCPATFASRQGLQYHMESDHEMVQHACTHCERVFKTRLCLTSHVLRHHEKRTEFKCEYCGNDFATIREVNWHVKVIHSNNVRCDLCNEMCVNPRVLMKHKFIHHGDRSFFKIRCNMCKSKRQSLFRTQDAYEKHLQKFH